MFPVLTHSFPPRRSSHLLDRLASRARTFLARNPVEPARPRLGPHRDAAVDDMHRPLGRDEAVDDVAEPVDHRRQLQMTIGCEGETRARRRLRSEEHTSELQSLMRISYAVFCLKKKKNTNKQRT